MLKAALYIRVSTDKQEELSPDAQKRLLLEYANNNHYLVPSEYIFIENGISGRNTTNRPEFKRMIALSKTNPKPFDAILVWKFSRFARNREDSIVYKSMLRKQFNIDVISITEQLGDNKISILIEAMLEAMDEYYSINLSEEVFRGMSENALRGRFQSRPPYGYCLSAEKGSLLIIPEEAQIIHKIFHLFVQENKSEYEISKILNQMGIKNANGNWFESRFIKYILQNPIYMGYVRWNRTSKEKNQLKEESEWIITKGSHEAIIEEELFRNAQFRLSKSKSMKHARPELTKKHWLSGLLKCSNCGRSLSFTSTCNQKTGKQYHYFQCYGYQKGLCNRSHYISETTVVPKILDTFHQHFSHLQVPCYSSNIRNHDEISFLNSRKLTILKKEERLKEAYLNNVDTLSEYKIHKETLEKEKSEINALLDSAYQRNNYSSSLRTVHNLYEILENKCIPDPIKNKALKAIIEKIIYNKENNALEIYYF